MAVVINEFEVVPERQDEPQGATPTERQGQAPQGLTVAELERVARTLRERLERVRAH
jgi:hypothetical protein